MGKLTATLG